MKNFLLILISLISMEVFGTAQFPDLILMDGEMYELNSNPLETYFNSHPDKRPETDVMMSALWRGYIATFEIREGKIYVVKIAVPYYEEDDEENKLKWKDVIDEVFPNSGDTYLDWLTGNLVIPNGEILEYIHMGYESIYSNYIIISVSDGIITERREMDYEAYEKFRRG